MSGKAVEDESLLQTDEDIIAIALDRLHRVWQFNYQAGNSGGEGA